MKILRITSLLVLLLLSQVFAQRTINYTFSVENCDGGENYQVLNGTMLEGQSMIFGDYTFPQSNTDAQFFYNLIRGGELGFPIGSLKENITCDILLCGICDLGIADNSSPTNLLGLFCLKIIITGEESGVHDSQEYYYLENNREYFLKLPLQPINSLLNYTSYSINNFTPYFLDENSEPDYFGIRKEVDDQFVTIYNKHFSTFGIGFKLDSPTSAESEQYLPKSFELLQNYPNPFNPTTVISYSIPESGLVDISIYNAIGEKIQTLIKETQSAGSYNVEFDASDLPSGLYLYTLTSNNYIQTKKMLLLK